MAEYTAKIRFEPHDDVSPKWMPKIYKNIFALNLFLNPQIRVIFCIRSDIYFYENGKIAESFKRRRAPISYFIRFEKQYVEHKNKLMLTHEWSKEFIEEGDVWTLANFVESGFAIAELKTSRSETN